MYRILPSQLTLSTLQFLGNMKPLEIESDESVLTATVCIANADGIDLDTISLTYTPVQNRVSIDLADIVRPYFHFHISSEGLFFQSRMLLSVSVNLMGEDISAYSTTIIRGGIAGIQGDVKSWCLSNPLSWHERRKYVLYTQPEYISFYCKKNDSVNVTLHVRKKGSNKSTALSGHGFLADKTGIYTLDVCPMQLEKLIMGEESHSVVFYEVETTGGARMQYVLDSIKSETERWFLWENSLGGLDTVRCYGEEVLLVNTEDKTVKTPAGQITYDVECPASYKQNTGSLTARERLWLLDFFRSPKRYVFREKGCFEIGLTESNLESNTSDNIYDYSFCYRLSSDKPFLNAGILSPEIGGVPPLTLLGGEDFTLPPHPSDIDLIAPGEGVFFAAMNAAGNAWGIVSYTQLLSDFKLNMQGYIEELLKEWIPWHIGQSGISSSASNSIYKSLKSQFMTLKASDEEIRDKVIDLVKVALSEAEQAAVDRLRDLKNAITAHPADDISIDAAEQDCEESIAYYNKVIAIAERSITEKLTQEMLQQLHLSSQENNVIALGYATDAQQAAFEHTNLIAESIDVSITNTQSLALILRSSEGNVLNTAATTDLSVVFRFNGHDITNEVKALTPAVTIVWERISKNNNHEGMTDEEWGNYALGRYVVTVKRAKKEQLSFRVSISDEDESRIIEYFKPNRKK